MRASGTTWAGIAIGVNVGRNQSVSGGALLLNNFMCFDWELEARFFRLVFKFKVQRTVDTEAGTRRTFFY